MNYSGVTKTNSGYEAFYVKSGSKVYIGHFFSEEMAARAVDATIGRLLNFPDFMTLEEIYSEDNRRRVEVGGFRGVYLHKRTGKWEAAIKVDGKRISIGYFPSAELAALAYDKQAKLIRGERARLNFPDDKQT